jgi:hypothetical protein
VAPVNRTVRSTSDSTSIGIPLESSDDGKEFRPLRKVAVPVASIECEA